MKKIACAVLAALLLLLCACSPSKTIGIPGGYVECDEHIDKGKIQDFADYARYVYPNADFFEQSTEYRRVVEKTVQTIKDCFADFKEQVPEFSFDESCIGEGDFVRIRMEGENFENYTVFFFDTDTLTLYYIHHKD